MRRAARRRPREPALSASSSDYDQRTLASRPWRFALAATFMLTALRLLALFATPLELYPDEAQYWLWSRTLDLGYYSKPPMIAWIIHLSTAIGGDAEPFVRIASPLFHAATGLVLFAVGRRLAGAWTGFFALLVYQLMPAVQLSSGIASTDAPLLFFLAVALFAYVDLPQAKRPVLTAAGLGAALGLAFLSKYAALYALAGIAIHLLVDRQARALWTPRTIGAAVVALLVVASPNVLWNAANGFATVEHTAANADLGSGPRFDVVEMLRFLIEQFGVFGLVPFGVLILAVVLAARRRLERDEIMLLCWVLPPLVVVTVQAFLTRANANWAAAAYVAGAVLAAMLLVRWRARLWLAGGLALQGLFAGLFLMWVLAPKTAEAMGAANSFKRTKGWSDMAEAVTRRAEVEQLNQGLSAIAVDDRFLFNALAYYGRDYFEKPGAAPLKIWLRHGRAGNQAEAEAPLTPADGTRVLLVTAGEVRRGQEDGGSRKIDERAALIGRDFRASQVVETNRAMLDARRLRRSVLIIGEDFRPLPRD